METPVVKKKKGISPIWILPIVALLIGGWLLYQSYRDAGIDIVVHFKTAEGITAGKTKVVYKGINVGVVRDIEVDPDVDGVALHIEMDRRTKKGLVEDTKFWVVKPKVSAGQISGLGTLFSGSYIAVQKGTSKKPSREFKGLTEPPPIPPDAPGLHIKLTADALGSIQRDTPVYYKNIQVGSVQKYQLNEDGGGVLINVYIEPHYKHLIKTKTRFWNSSGITFKGGLSGFKVRMESVASLIYGGISLYTPAYFAQSPPAKNGQVFRLYNDYDDAQFGLHMTLQLPTAEGIEPGSTKVMYRGFEAGEVTDVTFDQKKKIFTALISINPEAEFILREGTRFWVVRPEVSLTRIRNLNTMLTGVYIAFRPGGGPYNDAFVAQEPPAFDDYLPPGKKFTLVAADSKSFDIGAPVLYRNIKVGEIIGYELARGGVKVEARILVYQRYAHLVNKRTVFWKCGGLKLDVGINGVDLETGTLKSFLAGGVAFTNPGNKKQPPLSGSHTFRVYDSYRQARENVPALRDQGLNLRLQVVGDQNFSPGSPVLYKNIAVGRVTDLVLDDRGEDVFVDVLIEKKYAHLVRTTSVFYVVSGISVEGSLAGIRVEAGPLKSILVGGVAFYTPEPGRPAAPGRQFTLFKNLAAARDRDKKLITVRFAAADGLRRGSPVRYQGLPIGKVSKIEFAPDMHGVVCQLMVNRPAARLFTADARIWMVKPEVSLTGVSNLETVVTGPYITLRPGSGPEADEFVALAEPPAVAAPGSGLNLVLETDTLGSLHAGSPVYYRQIRVGRVTGTRLAPDARQVWIMVNIEPPYDRLVYRQTRFWNSSGIRVDAGLFSGVKVRTESVEALLAGGISMATPEGEDKGEKAASGDHFVLHPEGNKCWLKWRPRISLE
ncbi:MAG: MCE family protein [Deltaproteobacteria bacterium]|nr:MCE family protein [Deltaproteobacteria bacterium]